VKGICAFLTASIFTWISYPSHFSRLMLFPGADPIKLFFLFFPFFAVYFECFFKYRKKSLSLATKNGEILR